MVLTLIAEVLTGETLVTPGGPVDMDTASGREAFTWDGWLDELRAQEAAPDATGAIEVTGTAAEQPAALRG